ncbi:Gfo/Idh/MocA family oxidoreductase, partial [Streptomyces sp. NPDC046237]|uniref:Gfo/Idh/MocA family protein n=1 Tax=Streptomyces sp. NPDC046237 TaxID=3154914 RepID=UPI0033CD8DDA
MPDATTLLVVGAGDRGTSHARYALRHPDRARVVAVAEPLRVRRERFAAEHGLAADAAVADWRQIVERGRVSDAVLLCTLDRDHLEPALAFAAQGYHIMLEKPMAVDEESCRAIVDAVERAGVILAVGHVLRYTPYTRVLKRVVDEGRIGDVISVQHLEPVGHWHQAHSYVRGNWRRTDESTSMLMAKSCHDLDWLQHIVGEPPARVSSFGRLTHFTPANRPQDAADRCVECPVRGECVFDAVRFYGDRLAAGQKGWPLSVVLDDFTGAALEEALRTGPYGRCVYACDNDVVDHQVVAMEFAGGATATFTMTGFTEMANRRTQIFGTRGEIRGDGRMLHIHDFRTGTTEAVDTLPTGNMSAGGGHGGGDEGLMEAFVAAGAARGPTPRTCRPRGAQASPPDRPPPAPPPP